MPALEVEVLGDLGAGLAGADDEHRALGQLRRRCGTASECICVTRSGSRSAHGGTIGRW